MALFATIRLSFWLGVLALGWGYYLYTQGHDIRGPFIFADENTYFAFARNFSQGKSIAAFTQYGPAYPALASLFFWGSVVTTYKLIKAINVIIFISSIIPSYLLAKELFSHRWFQVLLPVITIIAPLSGFVYLIWAEPLYICLFYWACYLLCIFIQKPTIGKSILLSIFLSSLYYTKPASGLVLEIAAIITLLLLAITRSYIQRMSCQHASSRAPGYATLTAICIAMCFLINIPWMLHYLHLGSSIVGYPTATHELKLNISNQGISSFIFNFISSLFYQFSYVFVGSFGTISVLAGIFITQFSSLSLKQRYFILFLLLCVFGLIALCALGVTSYSALDYRMPNGRYFSVLLPLLTLTTLDLLFEKKPALSFLSIMILITTIIAIVASPLYTRSPIVFVSMPELSAILYLANNALVVWCPNITEPSFLLRITVPLVIGGFIYFILLLRNIRSIAMISAILICISMIFATKAEQHYVQLIAQSQISIHKLYIYAIKNHIDNITFDTNKEIPNLSFINDFWVGTPPVYGNSHTFIKNQTKENTYFVSTQKLNLTMPYSSYEYYLYKK